MARTRCIHSIAAVFYARSFVGTRLIPFEWSAGLHSLDSAGWQPMEQVSGQFTYPGYDVAARFDPRAGWTVAERFATTPDKSVSKLVAGTFGCAPAATYLPVSLFVPVTATWLPPSAEHSVRKQVWPDPDSSPWLVRVHGALVHVQVVESRKRRQTHYLEVSFGPPRFTRDGEPRREVFLGDHAHVPTPSDALLTVHDALCHAWQYLQGFVHPAADTRSARFSQVARAYRLARSGEIVFEIVWPTLTGRTRSLAWVRRGSPLVSLENSRLDTALDAFDAAALASKPALDGQLHAG